MQVYDWRKEMISLVMHNSVIENQLINMNHLLQKTFWILILMFMIPCGNAQAPPADPLVDSLLKELTRAKEDSNKVTLLMDIGNNVSYYDAAKALQYARQGLALSKKINYPLGIARTHYLSGNCLLDLGEYEKSSAELDSAEIIFETMNRMDMIGKITLTRGNSYYMQSDLFNASHYYAKATDIFHNMNDTLREIIPYQNMIATLGEIKNYDKAITMSLKLLKILEARKDSLQMAHAYNHLVINYTALGKMDEAKKYIPPLLSFIKNTIDFNLASESYNVIGEFYLKNGQYDTAIGYYKIALEKSLKDNYQPALFNLSLGVAYLKKNELTSAWQYLNKAISLSAEANSKDIYYRTCLPLSQYYEKTGDFKNAYKYLQEYSKLNDSILVAETRQYSTQLEAVFENNKKENEILRLKTAELKKTLAIKKRNNYLFAAGGLLLLTGIFFSLKSRNDRHKRKLLEQEKQLQEEKITTLEKEQQVISLQSMITGQETERSRIAKDLHDGLGGLFSTVKMYFSTLQHERPELATDPLFIKSFEMADNASVEMRRIAHNLMPEVLIKLGLINAVQDLCNNINAGRLLKISLQQYGMESRLQASMEIMLYRIIQELMNNIIKHSQATEVIVQFNRHSERLTITVEDNGSGFNIDEATAKNNAGINTIKSRVSYLNGELNIDSKKGVGTTVIMDFLLSASADL